MTTQTSLAKDSRTKQWRQKPAVPKPKVTEKRKDYFDVAGAIGSNCILLAASFFRDRISFYWYQHMCQSQAIALLPWIKFQSFL